MARASGGLGCYAAALQCPYFLIFMFFCLCYFSNLMQNKQYKVLMTLTRKPTTRCQGADWDGRSPVALDT